MNGVAASVISDSAIAIIAHFIIETGRMIGFATSFPLFTWVGVTGLLRVMVAVGLAAPVIHFDGAAVTAGGLPFSVLLLVKEICIGIGLGIAFGAPIWAAQAAGDIIDVYRGGSANNLFDPVNAVETSIMGQLNAVLAVVWIMVSGALPIILEAVYRSTEVWSPFSIAPGGSPDLARTTGVLLHSVLSNAVVLCAPALTAMVLTEIALLFVLRGARQLPVFDVASTAKNASMMLSLPVYALFMIYYMNAEFRSSYTALVKALGLF